MSKPKPGKNKTLVKEELSPLKLGDSIELRIEGIGSFGEGLAHSGGSEFFIPKAAPGDQVEVEVLEKKKGRYRGAIKRLIAPSSERISPRCQHFEICGGCDFQHLSYQDQMAWKIRITKHWIRRSPLAPYLEKISFDSIASPKSYGYRHRVRMQVVDKKLHYFKPHSNEIFELKECPILVSGFFEALQKKAEKIENARDWNQSFWNSKLVEDEANYEIGGKIIRFNEKCFTQANHEVNEAMWNRVEEDLKSLHQKTKSLDLYSGIGNFTLPMSDYFEKTSGVESHPDSIAYARKNSEINRKTIRWIESSSEDAVQKLDRDHELFDFILLDPPRTGAFKVVQTLARSFTPRITYISCNLESLIPDLIHLVKRGSYRIERWTVTDLFPETHHIESIVSLVKSKA